jgi:membrane protein required for colicin V production
MNWLDWMIVLVMAGAVISGLAQGFFRAASSLAGLILGLMLATWYYKVAAKMLEPLVHEQAMSDTLGFLAIAILVMVAAGIIGRIFKKGFKWLGIGWLDHLAGGAFGFVQGALLVTLGILLLLAFAPEPYGVKESKYASPFLSACRGVTHLSPDALAEAIRGGLKKLEENTPNWIQPKV